MRIFLISVLLACLGIQSSWACSCVPFSDDKQSFRALDLFFKGKVIESRNLPGGGSITTFEVLQNIKGGEQKRREVFSGCDSCSTSFSNQKEYWVRAHRGIAGWGTEHSHLYQTNMCLMGRRIYYDLDIATANADAAIKSLRNAENEKAIDKATHELRTALRHLDFLDFIFEYPKKFKAKTESNGLSYPNDPEYQAAEAASWRDFERQSELLARAVLADPENGQLLMKAAKAYVKIDNFSSALVVLEEVLAIDPGSLAAQDLMARVRLSASGDFTRGHFNYSKVKLFKQSLSGRPGRGVDFSDSLLLFVDAANLVAHDARFVRTFLTQTNFSKAHLEGANFRQVYDEMGSGGSNFSHAVMKRAILDRGSFDTTDFSGVNFADGQAREARFDGVNFGGANLTGADFSNSHIMNSSLHSATVDGTKFGGVEFRGTRITDIDFSQASVDEAYFHGAIVNCKTTLPISIEYHSNGIVPIEPECDGIPQNRDFSNRPWQQQNFSEMDLAEANFSEAQFGRSKFFNANLRGASFRGTTGLAFYAGADLTKADFSNADSFSQFTEETGFDNDGAPIGFPILNETIFNSAKLSTRQFISQWSKSNKFADLSTAQFHDVELRCGLFTNWSYLEKEIEEIKSNQKGPELADEQSRDRLKELEKTVSERKELFETEGRLVRFFVDSWPGVSIDDSCSEHLNIEAASGN